jgi:choline dehydrogenase
VLETEFAVVGGGSSGAVVAARLVEAGRTVVLLEAGPDHGPLAGGRWPLELVDARMLATTHDWGFAGGRWTFERARVIGGCSAHNGAIAAVGHRSDYDSWGLPGWSGVEVEPYFERALAAMRVRAYRDDEAGPFHARCLEAARRLGWPIASDLCDLDAGESFGLETVNVVGTTRWNTAFSHLDPVRESELLTIVDEVLVDRVVPGPTGPTVHGCRHDEPFTVRATTVVVAAGVYGTPAILQRSGVGPAAVLRSAGVDVRVDLPGVGAGLHDHPMVHAARRVGPQLQEWLDEAAATGFLPEEQTLGKFRSPIAVRDGSPYDLHVFPVCASDQTSFLHGRVHVEVACMDPRSRGSVSISSPDPRVLPMVDHRYLSDPEGHDIAVLRHGLGIAEELLSQEPLRGILGEPLDVVEDDAGLRASVAHYYHPVGTCRMGSPADSGAVCDADGSVRGVDRVFVADVSLMPMIPRANTNVPAVMIGERLADLFITGGRLGA